MKKGISPVVATVLLIAIVVVLALIIFLWAKGFIKESVQKKGENADSICGKIQLEMVYLRDTGELQITNIGNIPVYTFNVKTKLLGSVKNLIQNLSLPIGQTATAYLEPENYEEVKVVPLLLGQNKNGKRVPYTCKIELNSEIE